MTQRSKDLAADLLSDLQDASEVAKQQPAASPARDEGPAAPTAPVTGTSTAAAPAEAEPAVSAALYLSPRAWRLPAVRRDGAGLAVSAGPLRVRLRRP